MTLTLLLDLDDTLLGTNTQAFFPAYLQALARELSPKVSPEKMMSALMSGTRLMMASDDASRTLREVFDADFFPRIGVPRDELAPDIEYFYDEVFPTLQSITSSIAGAPSFVDWAFSQGYRVAVATDPIVPMKANHHRLRWAGLDPSRFELISAYEQFRFSKTYPAYYAEVLGQMGWPDGPVLMAGNDRERDIAPAQMLGLATFHVDAEASPGSEPGAEPRGSLAELRRWLESTDISRLIPSFKSVESVIAVLSASPAALQVLSAGLDSALWAHEPAPNDWALIEVICHLRDTEREIHQMQIKLFKDQSEPFIPRPDTAVWASQRNYLNENGPAALGEFTQARVETLAMLRDAAQEDWARKARHAIFGPTDFLEVVRFMADHDRMHIQQAWKVINSKH